MLMQALDTFIGLISIFLILSLIVSALGEGVSSWLNFKGRILRKSIATLLDEDMAASFFEHRAILRLQKERFLIGPRLPAYLPDKVIAEVIIDLCVNPPGPDDGAAADAQPVKSVPITPNTVDQAIRDLDPSRSYAAALYNLWQQADCNVDTFVALVADWFNLTGDRSTGWFRRRLAAALFVVGLAVAIVLNADTLYMFDTLSNDASLRESYVAYATDLVDDAREAGIACEDDACWTLVDDFLGGAEISDSDEQAQLASLCGQAGGFDAGSCRDVLAPKRDVQIQVCAALGVEGECTLRKLISDALPEATPLLGFDLLKAEVEAVADGEQGTFWSLKVFGWILTAAAVSLGAPFWFDLLQKIVQIRSSVKPATSPPVSASPGQQNDASTASVPAARSVIRAAPASAAALDDLGRFDSRTFGFSPVNLFWSARLSKLAYAPDSARIIAELEEWGAEGRLLDWGGSQCIVAHTPRAAFLSFRGTESNIEDWLTDAMVTLRPPPWDGAADYTVHTGFDDALEDIWIDHTDDDGRPVKGIGTTLEEAGVFERNSPIWLSGHSLGGALAALASLRLSHYCRSKGYGNVIGGIHTFGQPRVGDPACAAALEQAFPARYFRSVNNRDVVPRVPLPKTPDIVKLVKNANAGLEPGEPKLEVLDYAHAGRVIYFNDVGKAMMDPPIWYRGLDTLAAGSTIESIKLAARETVSDHSMDRYVELQRTMLDVESLTAN